MRRTDLMELRQVCEALGVSPVEFVRRFEEAVAGLVPGGRSGAGGSG